MLIKNLNLKNKKIIITGGAGFIGASLIMKLLKAFKNINILAIDNLNSYYDVSLKKYRISEIKKISNKTNSIFTFIKSDISNKEKINKIFLNYKPDIVINLAAQAGVRYSIINPDAYIKSNIIGFYNILEACRNNCVKHLIFASSSSVYGQTNKFPLSIQGKTDYPVSLYAATKKSNEILAYSYSKLYNIPVTGLRFFTVYGPAGRPDMAYFSFTNKLINKEKIKIFNYGKCKRDFTYIDDIVDAIIKIMQVAPKLKKEKKDIISAPYKIYNIGNNRPVTLLKFIKTLQEELINAKVLSKNYNFEKNKEFISMQQGDVIATCADISLLKKDFGFEPKTTLRNGLKNFADWYKKYYKI